MKSLSFIILLITSFLFFGCASNKPSTSATIPPAETSESTVSITESTTSSTQQQPAVQASTDTSSDEPIPLKNLKTKKGYPYAIKTKWPGLVKSPYAQDKTLVDVSNLAPDSPARCPHTGKIFIVP